MNILENINVCSYIIIRKKLIQHEHIIYCSIYFIKKLRGALHWYIFGTWIYPKEFKKLFIILYQDFISRKRYTGLFEIINDKTLDGYMELFTKICSIIPIENTKKLKIERYSTDFEQSLLSALNIIFQDIGAIGCYFHFCKNIRKKG